MFAGWNRSLPALALLCSTASFLGCPGVIGPTDAGPGDGDGDIELPPRNPPDAEFDIMANPSAAELVDAYDQFIFRCTDFGGAFLLEVDEDAVRLDVRPFFEASYDNPAIEFDAANAASCAAEIRADRDCVLFAEPDADSACNNIFRGTLALGESCDAYGECAGGECVGTVFNDDTGETVCGVCEDVPEDGAGQVGDPCEYEGDCEDGLFCPYRDDGQPQTCTAGEVGDYCDWENDCQPELFCPYRGDGNSSCTAGEIGDYCDYDSDCQEGSFCPYDPDQDSSCIAYAGLGDECYNSANGTFYDCADGLYCNYGTTVCEEPRALGEVCFDAETFTSFNCAEGLDCDTGNTGLCVSRAGLGESCQDLACEEELYCEFSSDTCVEGGTEGDSCQDIGCAPGFYCDYEVDDEVCRALPEEGEICTGIYECTGDLVCAYSGGEYFCRQPRVEGGACTYEEDGDDDDDGCNAGLTCDPYSNTCYDEDSVGDAAGDSCPPIPAGCGGVANTGLVCKGEWDNATCVEVEIVDLDGDCDLYTVSLFATSEGSRICRNSLSTTFCQPDDAENPEQGGTCTARPGEGEACDAGSELGDCAFGNICEIDYELDEPVGVCLALIELGESCQEGDLCQYNARCTLEDEMPRCAFDYDTGEQCVEPD